MEMYTTQYKDFVTIYVIFLLKIFNNCLYYLYIYLCSYKFLLENQKAVLDILQFNPKLSASLWLLRVSDYTVLCL